MFDVGGNGADKILRADRCAVTLAVISTVKTRTCMGCQRKALLELPSRQKPVPAAAEATTENGADAMEVEAVPVEVKLEEEDTGVVINAMMKAATCCLHCGGRWMRIL